MKAKLTSTVSSHEHAQFHDLQHLIVSPCPRQAGREGLTTAAAPADREVSVHVHKGAVGMRSCSKTGRELLTGRDGK